MCTLENNKNPFKQNVPLFLYPLVHILSRLKNLRVCNLW